MKEDIVRTILEQRLLAELADRDSKIAGLVYRVKRLEKKIYGTGSQIHEGETE